MLCLSVPHAECRARVPGLPQAQSVLLEVQAAVLTDKQLRDEQRAAAAAALALADKALADGADEFLQLLNMASQLQQAVNAPAAA